MKLATRAERENVVTGKRAKRANAQWAESRINEHYPTIIRSLSIPLLSSPRWSNVPNVREVASRGDIVPRHRSPNLWVSWISWYHCTFVVAIHPTTPPSFSSELNPRATRPTRMIDLTVKTLDSQNHVFSLEDDVSRPLFSWFRDHVSIVAVRCDRHTSIDVYRNIWRQLKETYTACSVHLNTPSPKWISYLLNYIMYLCIFSLP